MTLFEMALRSRLPMIRATTSDLVNVRNVIRYYVGRDRDVLLGDSISGFPEDGSGTVIVVPRYEGDLGSIYEGARESGGTVVLLNCEEGTHGYALDVGEIPVPEKLMRHYLNGNSAIYPEVRGLTLLRARELLQLCSATYGDLEPRNLRSVRRMLVPPTPGLEGISIELGPTIPRHELTMFLSQYQAFWESPTTGPLSPRGLLLTGKPGTGKTHMAKMLAKELGCPLYRASLAGAMDRWHGQSEQNLRRILSAVEQEAPCVLLLDEVEKEISTTDDSGVSSRMLAMLLWWLSEHRSKVITVMTTNDRSKLPPELYRRGRVNEVIEVGGLSFKEAARLTQRLISAYAEELDMVLTDSDLSEFIQGLEAIDETLTPAYIGSEVEELIRRNINAGL